MRIGLISDTHGFLDDVVFSSFAECDEIWHAGDFGPVELLHRLKAFKPVRGVFGNIDGDRVRSELTRDLTWDCDGVRVYMTHIGGHPGHYDARARRELDVVKPGLFICGHTHVVRVMRDPTLGLLHLNPGASGHQGWHTSRTILRFTVEASVIGGVELIELGPRGQGRAPAILRAVRPKPRVRESTISRRPTSFISPLDGFPTTSNCVSRSQEYQSTRACP